MDTNKLEMVMSSRGFKPYNYKFDENEKAKMLFCEHRNNNEKIHILIDNDSHTSVYNINENNTKKLGTSDIYYILEVIEKEIYKEC